MQALLPRAKINFFLIEIAIRGDETVIPRYEP